MRRLCAPCMAGFPQCVLFFHGPGQTQWAGGEHEFIPTDVMNILSFYHSDECGGRPFEVLSSMLASDALQAPIRRLDNAPPQSMEQTIPAPKLPVRAPHFQVAPAPSRATSQPRTR